MSEASERAKYERVWEFPEYRKHAPGESLVDEAIRDLGIQPGDSLIDFGCGTGRPVARMRAYGINATGVDFAANCLDEGIDFPFVQACLWDMPDMASDYGYCTDVMEHIPPDRVQAVLSAIRDRCTSGAWFQIATRPDVMGRLVGEPLHLTVQPADWWADQIAAYWPDATFKEGRGWMKAVAR